MKNYRFLISTALIFVVFLSALTSCSSTDVLGDEVEDPTVTPQELPIAFRCMDAPTRSIDLSTVYDNFCVRSFKVNTAGTKSIVMPNYLVKYIDGEWVYNGLSTSDGADQFLKYWDLSAKSYTFAAVTPATKTGTNYSIDDNGNFSITVADMTTDWLIARTVRRGINDDSMLLDYDDLAETAEEIDASATKTSEVFPTPASPVAEVPLNFHHILAKVVIKAYADSETELIPLEVGFNNIGIAPATFNSATGWTTTPLDYQQLYNQNTVITSEQNSRETAQLLTELFVIPQQATDATNSSLVQIKVKPNDNDDKVRNFNIPDLWESNNTYIYYLKFEGGETGEVILFDVVVEPMTNGGEAEDEQHNW